MAKIYISSTYEDLKEYREAARTACLRLGHQVTGVEDYSASDERPVSRALADVAASDAYLGIVAWRYGLIPSGPENPENLSITHLEFREALKRDLPRLIFVMAEDPHWPPRFIDKSSEEIQRFRQEVAARGVVDSFSDAADLQLKVTAAIATLKPLVERRQEQQQVDAFFSYNSADSKAVTALAQGLIREGVRIWMWDISLQPGRNVRSETMNALRRARTFVAFIGGLGVGQWQKEEIEKAAARVHAEEDFHLIPVLLPDAKPELVPANITDYYWIRFRSFNDPDAYTQLLNALRRTETPRPPDLPLEEADLQVLIELLFRVVVRLRERPEMLNSLEPTTVWDAVRKISPQASTMDHLRSLNQELSSEPSPGPLWSAWMRNTRANELAALLHHAGPGAAA